jgi:glutathione synthase/RimK-type ligase-like ATP-grasp enzyme
MDEQGWQRAVLKPSVGASGHNVHLLACEDPIADLLATSGLAAAGLPVIVQEFVPEVRGGELAFVFFDGDFSHVFRRRPAEGEFRVNSQYQGVAEPAETPAEAVRQARAVLDALPALPLYARVDGVLRDGRLILMELELNEPGLMLQLAPGSAGRFAEATLRRLR